jgi:hypothetical protein
VSQIVYTPPPTLKRFIRHCLPGELFYSWALGPVGGGKTTAIFFKLVHMARLQAPGPDGIRRTRAVVVRNTMPQLKDTTIASWNTWFRDGVAGEWKETEKKFVLRFDDVECEVLFRALDTADDVARVLSLEVTFALIDEFVQIPRAVVDALSARLGRYPSARDGGATNWGMWGASNTDTEDNWWFDYLHAELPSNAATFVQPSGFSPDAENLENLPGGAAYYTNQAIGKSQAWVKQFIEVEWGYSVAGKPVVPAFSPAVHVSNKPLMYDPRLPLVAGFDPGLGGSAFVFGQQDLHGRLIVLGELIRSNISVVRLIEEAVRPYIRRRFPDAQLIVAPDPAASGRSSTDARSVVDILRKYFDVKVESNNRLPLRLDAIDHFATRLTGAGPALQVDARECPVLVRALKGGWRYVLDNRRDVVRSLEPEKNAYSHPGDAFGYLARYFHRQTEREMRHRLLPGPRQLLRSTGTNYHFG